MLQSLHLLGQVLPPARAPMTSSLTRSELDRVRLEPARLSASQGGSSSFISDSEDNQPESVNVEELEDDDGDYIVGRSRAILILNTCQDLI